MVPGVPVVEDGTEPERTEVVAAEVEAEVPEAEVCAAGLTDEAAFEQYKDEFDVDFVYMGYYERAMDGEISFYLSGRYPAVFSAGGITVYDVR